MTSLLFTSIMALAIAGCNNTPAEEKEEPFSPNLDTTTESEIIIKGHYSDFNDLLDQINVFNTYYPNIAVHYVPVSTYTKEATIKDLFVGDNAPDIYFVNNGWESIAMYVPFFEHAEDLSDPSTGIDLSKIREDLIYKDKNGHVPVVPIFTNAYGMIVNEELFENNNLSIPKTYNELIQVCNSLIDLGYESPVMSWKGSIYSLYFPYFLSTINGNQEAIEGLNNSAENGDNAGGKYLRSALEKALDFNNYHFIDKDKCNDTFTKDDRTGLLKPFYKGDIPMIFTEANRLSSSYKSEADSEDWKKHNFKYSFQPIPTTEEGGYYYNTHTLSFGVNKDSKNLAVANEFMRFLIRYDTINTLNSAKRQISPAKVLGEDKFFNSFKDVLKEDHVLYNYKIGLSAEADTQARLAFNDLLSGTSIDTVIANYGSYK